MLARRQRNSQSVSLFCCVNFAWTPVSETVGERPFASASFLAICDALMSW